MTILLGVYDAHGKMVGHCNARCYNATPPSELRGKGGDFSHNDRVCKCICGGANHAAGSARAVRNVNERHVGLTRAAREAFAKIHGLNADNLTVVDRLRMKNSWKAAKLARARLQPPKLKKDDLFSKLGKRDTSEGPSASGGAQQRRE